ncbi:MAG: hypothetical protein V1769_01800 [Thermoplasmatota archaeon]
MVFLQHALKYYEAENMLYQVKKGMIQVICSLCGHIFFLEDHANHVPCPQCHEMLTFEQPQCI